MRYQPDEHILVNSVIQTLNIPNRDFPMGEIVGEENGHPVYSTDNNILYLRGQHFREKDLANPYVKLPYNVPWSLKGLDAGGLQSFAMNQLLPHATYNVTEFSRHVYGENSGIPVRASSYSSEEMLSDNFTVYQQKFKDIGYWNLLYKTLGNEGFIKMRDINGYDSNVPNGSSPALLPTSDYGSSTYFRTLTDGYDKLPIRIHQEYEKLGGQTTYNMRLAKIKNLKKNPGGYRYCLVFIETETCKRSFETTDKVENLDGNDDEYPCKCKTKHYVLCKDLILAMPRRSLELVSWNGFNGSEQKELLNSVIIQPSNKLLLGYEQPWWRIQNIIAGRSISDTPLRMTVSFKRNYYYQIL